MTSAKRVTFSLWRQYFSPFRCAILIQVVVLTVVTLYLLQRLSIPTVNPGPAVPRSVQDDLRFENEQLQQRPVDYLPSTVDKATSQQYLQTAVDKATSQQYLQTAVDKATSQQTSPFSSLMTSAASTDEEKIHEFAVRVLGYSGVPDQCNGPARAPEGEMLEEYDLMQYGPFSFMKTYKNPCWLEENKLHCMPYFYLAGFPKCGTTDMYRRLVMHPDVQDSRKEPNWITRRRFPDGNGRPLEWYTNNYALPLLEQGKKAIVGDGSVSTIFDNHAWALLPGNQNCLEPRVLAADYIRHLDPGAKIIVMLRNPTSRLFSEYHFYGNYPKSPEDFHQQVEEQIISFRSCLKEKSLRACAYPPYAFPGKPRLFVGLYHVFVEDWLLRFPRDQFLPVQTESVFDNIPTVMRTVFRFLNLKEGSDATMEDIAQLEKQRVGHKKEEAAPMLPETQRMLDEFYRPFNQRLAAILQDTKFLWEEL